MRKTDKKIDNQLRQVLTATCDFALQNTQGYQSISHTVNYNQFPASLVVTCLFDDQQHADNAMQERELLAHILEGLNSMSVNLKSPQKQVRFQSK